MKKLLKILTLTCFMLVISGCMKMKVGVKILDEETAETTMVLLIDEDLLEASGSSSGDPFEEMLETFEDMDAKIEEIEEKIDGSTYVGYEIIIDDEDYNQNFIDSYLEVDKINGKETYTLTMDLEDMSSQMDMDEFTGGQGDIDEFSVKQMKKNGVEVTMSITMPYNITDATFGDVSGKTVTIDIFELLMDGEEEVEIIATEGSSASSNILLYLAGGIVVLAGGAIAYIVIANKKKKSNEIPETINNEPFNPITSNIDETLDTTKTNEDASTQENVVETTEDTLDPINGHCDDTSNTTETGEDVPVQETIVEPTIEEPSAPDEVAQEPLDAGEVTTNEETTDGVTKDTDE